MDLPAYSSDFDIAVMQYIRKYTPDHIKINLDNLRDIHANVLNWNDLTLDINVSTVVFICNIGQQINLLNATYHMGMNDNVICKTSNIIKPYDIYYDPIRMEMYKQINLKCKKKIDKAARKRVDFDNQITFVMFSREKYAITQHLDNESSHVGFINIKMFKNGTIQLTGCRTLADMIEVLMALLKLTPEPVINKDHLASMGPDYDVSIMRDPHNIFIDSIRIIMINSNYHVSTDLTVNRNTIHAALTSQPLYIDRIHKTYKYNGHIYTCVYDSSDNKGVTIDYCNPEGEKLAQIVIYQSSRVVITGGKTLHVINNAYLFIKAFIEEFFITKAKNEDITTHLHDYIKLFDISPNSLITIKDIYDTYNQLHGT